jgi:PAS domain S-box-containing protein
MVYRLKSSGVQKHLWVYYAFVPPDTVIVHTEDISERKRAETRQVSLAGIIENSRNEIYIFDAKTLRFAEVNRAARDNLGYSMEELSCLTPLDLKPTYTPETFSALVQPLRTGTKSKIEFTTVHRRKDGSLYPVEVHLQLGVYETRPAFIAIILDITEQKRIEAQLRESLQEKETLLREIHHRVKNNLQIISSLLYFQAKQVRDPESVQVFLEGQNRLRAMILVHEQLYSAANLSRVDFSSYVRLLVQQLAQSYSQLQQKIRLSVNSDEVQLPIEIALPCGMILNELLTNIFKYAYPNGQSGAAVVKITRRDTGIQLQVTDDGVGLPDTVDVTTPTSFGMQLINNLAAQVKGTVQYEQDHGTKVTVTIDLPEKDGASITP